MALKSEYTLNRHQDDAVATALKRDGNILLSHPVGSGKTLSSLAIFEALKKKGGAGRALVVTPASLRQNYGENGVKKFTDSDYVIYGNKQENEADRTGKFREPSSSNPEYGVVSYEMFRSDPEKYIKGHNADTVIFDEIHRIKNDTSQTYEALKNSRPLFKNFIGMTGSIVSNTPADVVPLVDAMTAGNHRLGSKSSFENRFVSKDSKGNKIVTNPLLVRALMAPYVHHVTDDQLESNVGMTRPDKEIHNINIPLSGRHEEYYRYVINQLDPVTKAKLAHGLGKLGKADLDAIFSKMLKSRQVANSMATIDDKMSLEDAADQSVKVKRLLDDVQSHLSSTPDGQVIIHSELIKGGIDVLEAGLKKRGIEYGKFIGKGNAGVNEKARQQDVDDYNSGKKKVILISSAGGEGIDLPNTTLVASLDGHWNPEKINQVEARGIRMGGLSHRAPKDRKVIVNRYITTLPTSNLDAMSSTSRLISPLEIAKRVMTGEKVFYNPYKTMPTVDQLMYQVAKSKAVGNSQLKDLFEKTSAFSVHSDREILQSYLDRYGDKLLTGDYGDGSYINEPDENRYISKLRQYYSQAARKNVIPIYPKQYDEYKARTPMSHTVKTGVVPGLVVGGVGGAYMGALTLGKYTPLKEKALLVGAGAGISGLIGGVASWRHFNKPHYTTSASGARKYQKLSDPELLKMLRGEAVTKEEIKKQDHFIRLK